MIGILLYLTTIGGVPHFFCVFVAFFAFCKKYYLFRSLPEKLWNLLIIYLLFILGAVLNNAVHAAITGSAEIPYVLLLPLIFVVAYALDERDIKWLIFLTTVEALIGLYEYMIGVNTVLPWVTSKEIGVSAAVYNNKVKGLSEGSSTYTLKLLAGLVLVNRWRIWYRSYQHHLINALLMIAIIMCFSRTVLVTAVFFQMLLYFRTVYKHFTARGHIVRKLIYISVGILGIVCIVFVFSYFWDSIMFQLFRGREGVDLSGREDIWQFYINFIRENLFWGNGSFKLLEPVEGNHAHNSYLQLVSTNGLFLAFLFLFPLLFLLKKRDYIYILPFFIVSTAQYGLFWGFSYLDVVFALFLFNRCFKSVPCGLKGM